MHLGAIASALQGRYHPAFARNRQVQRPMKMPLASACSAPWSLRAGRSDSFSGEAAQDKQAQAQLLHSVRQLNPSTIGRACY